ncbi:acetyl esterase [Sphingomonas zeicaulis]|uniref:alpha/beta hydrolase n=1 Tax=Sphingomonas zeicaulis TaxID=1632740 RepID=UPI003D2375AF
MSDPIDPDLAAFNRRLTNRWREHPPLDGLSIARARAVAEIVRAPLRAGGPAMARTDEHRLEIGDHRFRVRIHRPTEDAVLPALVYLHGGGFTLFSIDTHDRLMREYAAAGGFAVVGVDYPLSPEARYPVALDAVLMVLRWLAAKAGALGIDATRLAIGGDSAGANLALAASLRLRDGADGPKPRAMLLNYGTYSDRSSDAAEAELGGPNAVLNRAEMDWFYTNYLRDDADRSDPYVCPLLADMKDVPPALLIVAGRDLLAEQSFALAERLTVAGVEHRMSVYPGATHSFLEAMATAPIAMRAIGEGASWVKVQLAPLSYS